ncbi:hypothetical protein CC1G_15630 [Coprinopsis cinerea okayama7|uniref:Uncharacterized protein n=1 Tax=Coprinopsis cinerea (strain Okayama-7 / 130 / ATCC MYA-4618 / FGSC 9003) TaxID=240176 RepID=D6RN81_COPC7|nr:hypothetical protein CC1G_15630 [Coprinopsis cinerea okayama7\|eukprot:XP_002911088.1 hypothetical protein CC1G_15630 [Coprinopsis cinerea okayama7\
MQPAAQPTVRLVSRGYRPSTHLPTLHPVCGGTCCRFLIGILSPQIAYPMLQAGPMGLSVWLERMAEPLTLEGRELWLASPSVSTRSIGSMASQQALLYPVWACGGGAKLPHLLMRVATLFEKDRPVDEIQDLATKKWRRALRSM